MDDVRPTKDSTPSVTVIVPTYNRAKFLGRAIQSVLDQTLAPAQVIVVDDGSADATQEVLNEFRERVHAIQKPNGGKASALNLGFKFATGEVIWVFDDDDIATPDALEKLAFALESHPECGFAYGSYDHLIESKDGDPEIIQPNLNLDPSIDLRLSILERCYIFQPGLLVRRTCYDAVGPFDEKLIRSQDYEMLLRLSRRYAGVRVDGVLFHQRQHSGLRGSAANPVVSGNLAATWMQYDRLIFSGIYQNYPLSEFLPGRQTASARLSPSQESAALLERCCVMARKGMWEFASADLKSVAMLAQSDPQLRLTASELRPLQRLFGPYSYADHTIGESGMFFAGVNDLAPRSFRWLVIRLLFSPLLRELSFSVRNGHIRYFLGTARKCLLFGFMCLRRSQNQRQSVDSISGVPSR